MNYMTGYSDGTAESTRQNDRNDATVSRGKTRRSPRARRGRRPVVGRERRGGEFEGGGAALAATFAEQIRA